MKKTLVLAATVAAVWMIGAPAGAAPPPGACHNPAPARPVVQQLPWAQQLLDPQRVWQHSNGSGVVVAVVDSGVDADHPQLAGKVLRGEDFFLFGDLPGSFDCVSHGTAAASIIVAEPAAGIGFHGVAPGARILPVRVSERDITDDGNTTTIDPEVLARGIWYAVDQGAKVLNLSLAGPADNFFVRKAVEYAVSKDVLVVAAAGNLQQEGKPGPPSFPAAYPGVLGVGSIDIEGARASASQVGDFVDIVAPGTDVLGATRVGGHTYFTGTSFAAPFVAGTAALVRSAWPKLTAPQVVQRLQATAAPARGGNGSPAYGAGVIDPYRAVTDGLTTASPAAAPKLVPSIPDPEQVRNTAWWRSAGGEARLWTVMAAGVGLLLVVVAVVVPRGRRRRWAPARVDALPAEPVREEPPDEVFLLPPPPVER